MAFGLNVFFIGIIERYSRLIDLGWMNGLLMLNGLNNSGVCGGGHAVLCYTLDDFGVVVFIPFL